VKVVFVCGSRDFSNKDLLFETLDAILDVEDKVLLVHGNAAGADLAGREWALSHKFKHQAFLADWNAYGKAAGPIRNKEMLDELVLKRDEGHQVFCFAFKSKPVSIGTDHMISLLQKNELEVEIHVESEIFLPEIEENPQQSLF